MRQITERAKEAWEQNKKFKKDNTVVTPMVMMLFDNMIAGKHYKNGAREYGTFFSMHGWNTVTTRERLQAVGVKIRQRNGYPEVYYPQSNEWRMIDDNCIYYLSPDRKRITLPRTAEIPAEYYKGFYWR